MATAKDYAVDFGYGAKDGYFYGPNGIIGPFHKGNDRPTPTGTPIVIAGTTIGLTGASGNVGGPHLHTQAGSDSLAQQTVDPTPYDFKPGTVTKTGEASQWGRHVIVKTSTVYVVYAHLSRIDVSVGQVLNDDMYQGHDAKYWYDTWKREIEDERSHSRLNKGDIENYVQALYGKKPTQAELSREGDYIKEFIYNLIANDAFKSRLVTSEYEQVGTINNKPVFQKKGS